MHISLYYNVLQNILANIIIESKIQHVSLLIYIYIYIIIVVFVVVVVIVIALTMQFTSYKYIFQLPKHTKSLPFLQPFPYLNAYVLYILFSLLLNIFFIFIYVLF